MTEGVRLRTRYAEIAKHRHESATALEERIGKLGDRRPARRKAPETAVGVRR